MQLKTVVLIASNTFRPTNSSE